MSVLAASNAIASSWPRASRSMRSTPRRRARSAANWLPLPARGERKFGSIRAGACARLWRVLHLGDRGLATHRHKAVVAADGDKGEAHLDHLLGIGGGAAMDAGLNLVPLAAVEDLLQSCHHPFVGLVAARRVAERDRQIGGT